MRLDELTALELGEKLSRGEVKVMDAVQAALVSAEASSETNAFITRTPERALADAAEVQKRLDRGEMPSPLAGVPMSLKDNICSRNIRTTCASRILGDFKPPYSAHAAERLEMAGGVLMGKTNMDEFAMGSTSETSAFGPVRNPWNRERAPGGSSGGAAAAVASRACWYALGSDTGGSIRQPAAFCGVTGIKPTYGAVSRYGLVAYASSLDQIGVLAPSAADCAAVLDLIMGRDPRDATSLPRCGGKLQNALSGDIRGLNIGLPAEYFGEGLDPETEKAVLESARVLEGLGARLERFSLPLTKYSVPAYYIIACAEASSNLARYDGVRYGRRADGAADLGALYRETRSQGFGTEAKRRILLGTFVLSEGFYENYYRKAWAYRERIKAEYWEAFQKYDLLLAPTALGPAPRLGESLKDPLTMYRSDSYMLSVNLAGLPALSMPCGFDRDGLPIGAQLIGPAMGESAILNVAHTYQSATNYHRKRPEGGRRP